MTREEKAGLGFAAAEILAVGLVPAFSKLAVTGFDPLLYGAVCMVVAGAVAAGLAARRGELRLIFERKSLPRLVAIALAGTTVTTLLLLYGARGTDGVSAALLLQSEPVFSLVLTRLVWRQGVPARQIAGTLLLLGGIALVLWGGAGDERFRIGVGALFVLLVPLGWQLSHVLALRVMPPQTPWSLAAARYLYGGTGLVALQLVAGQAAVGSLGARGLAMAVFQGIVLFFCGTLFWYETIRRIDLSRATAIVTPCEPLMSVVFVWVVLGTLPTAFQWTGLALMLPGMALVVFRRRVASSRAERETLSASAG